MVTGAAGIKFSIMHRPGKVNTVADLLSRYGSEHDEKAKGCQVLKGETPSSSKQEVVLTALQSNLEGVSPGWATNGMSSG